MAARAPAIQYGSSSSRYLRHGYTSHASGDSFGMCKDSFGVNWMVNITGGGPGS